MAPTIISDSWPVLPTPALPGQGKGEHSDSPKYFHCCWLLKPWWSDSSVQPVNVWGFQFTGWDLPQVAYAQLGLVKVSDLSRLCHLSLFPCLLITQLPRLFSSCSFDLLSGVSLTARRVSWHPPGKITVNPEVADPLWGAFQPLRLVCCYSYLDREFLWLLSCPGAVSSKDTIPCCLREEVSLVSVQIPKSWFHFGPQTECFKAALDFSSASSMSKILVSWFGFVPLSDRNAGKL